MIDRLFSGSQPRPLWRWLLIVFVGFGGPSLGFAGKVERVKAPAETPLEFVTTVTAPMARHVAVSDVAGVVAVGHRMKHPVHVSLYRLDEQGAIAAGEPIALTLPKPDSLSAHMNFPLGVLFHPRLPLLYVWQDIDPVMPNVLVDPQLTAEFDHLFIYSVAEAEPKLLLATARGIDYASGNLVGGFALNDKADRLYVPSMQQEDATKKLMTGVGWIVLEPDGLPAFDPPDAIVEVDIDAKMPEEPPIEWEAATIVHAAKLAAFEQAKAAGTPLVARRYLEISWTFQTQPSPYNYAPLNDDIVFGATHSGVANWILPDRLGRFSYFYIQPYVPYRYRVTVHTTAPCVYIVPVTYDGHIVRLEHADGYFTLTPQTLLIDSFVYHSTPLLLEKTNQIAIGGNGKICLIDLDEEGRMKPSAVQMTVNNPTVEGIAWSEKFARLYVPVEPQQ